MIILLDMDEVLTDLLSGINELYNSRNGANYGREDYFCYRWWEVWGCEYDYADKLCHEFVVGEGHKKMGPIPGSIEAVQRLKAEGHKLIIATSRKIEYQAITRDWLDKIHGLNSFDGIYLLNYYGDGRKRKKSEVAKEIGADIAIDDQVIHATDIVTAEVPCLVLDSPWNRDEELPNLATRVGSWEIILQEVDRRK